MENENNIREVLPQMVSVSNNSRLTHEVAVVLTEKLTKAELASFKRWIQLIESEKQIEVNRNKNKFW